MLGHLFVRPLARFPGEELCWRSPHQGSRRREVAFLFEDLRPLP
ncbi:hypothetical protein BN2537_389 [Streptomyces venezuelae]|nr:hypothetical protein BN2537_389 [Streptomyces venezuelae]